MRKSWVHVPCRGSLLPVLALLSGFSLAQATATGTSQEAPVATFRAHADLVLIPVTVTDKLNRFVLGLQKADFHLFEDGVEQTLEHFNGEDAPLSVGVLFDESGSMTYKLRTSRDAAAQLLNALNKEDEAFLLEFSDITKISIGFTGNMDDLRGALKNAQAGGLTAMLDAIVQIYAMGVFDPLFSLGQPPEQISGPRLLSEIATQTGGRAFAAAAPSDLPSVASRIAIELRNQYVLGYYPSNKARDGKYRHVELRVSEPPGLGSSLKLHWRLGYFAPAH